MTAPVRSRALVRAPRILFVVAAGVLLTGLVARWGDWPAIAMIVVYLGWLLFEVPVTFHSAVAVKDVKTLVPYALARIATVGCGVLLPSVWPHRTVLFVIPAVLFGAGIAVREVAIRTLGRFYSHHVARRTDQVAVTTGPYRLIRHPAYAGMLVAHVGFVVFFLNPASVVFLGCLFAAVIWRIQVEGKVLWDMPGYSQYATGRARLIPGVW